MSREKAHTRRNIFAALVAWAILWASGAVAQTADHRGIFIATPVLQSPKDGVDAAAYQVPGIDGGAIRIPWRVLEPSPGQYDWSLLDREIDKIVAAGGKYAIGIQAGANSPRWLVDAGAKVVSFDIEKSETRPCVHITMPVPWDRMAMRSYVHLHRQLRRHLEAKGVNDDLVMVKVSYVHQQTLELRLPRHDGRPRLQRDGSLAPCQPSNAVETWQAAGYTPTLVLNAWTAVATNLAHIFEDQLLVVPFLESSASFPAIDDDGKRVARRQVTLSDRIIWRGIDSDFGARFGVQHSALRHADTSDVSPRVMTYSAAGAAVVMQTNLFAGKEGAGCQKDRHSPQEPCTAEGYRQLLERGIDEGADALEIWQADALKFPAEIGTAKGRL